MPTNPSMPTFLTAWTFEPSITLALLVAGAIYAAGLRDLHRRGRLGSTVAGWQIACFVAGLLAVLLALESPLDSYDDRLFSVHMAQHLLLLMVAPPLLLLGKPIPVLLLGAPRAVVRRVARTHARTPWLHGLTGRLTSPAIAWLLYVGDLVLWHVPALYQATLLHQGVHLLEHACFFSTGLLFWWVIVQPQPGPHRQPYVVRMACAWAAVPPMIGLGALFTFATTLWYPFYGAEPRLFGISALTDQAMGGLIMWIPGSMMHVAAALLLFNALLARDERLTAEAELAAEAEDAAAAGVAVGAERVPV